MKKNLLATTMFTAMALYTQAQTNTFPATGSAGIGTTTPNPSSILEMSSTTKGMLLPRMTVAQRNAIVSPAIGLMIYQTNNTAGFYYYNGSGWTAVTPIRWSLTGNAGTIPGTNFIGTTDAQPLMFKINNIIAGLIDSTLMNTSIGFRTLDSIAPGTFNSAFGFKSLSSAQDADYNTAIGASTLRLTTTGSYNTASGGNSLYHNTVGAGNTANGYASLLLNTEGASNTAIGYTSLFSNTFGSNNTASGAGSLYFNTTGQHNTASGAGSLNGNTSGESNSAFGSFAGATSNGSYNTLIGAQSNTTVNGLTNATALGYQTVVDASNKVRIGNTVITSIGGGVSWSVYSDARVKKDIQENVPGLKFINQLRPVSYHYNIQKENELMGIKDDKTTWAGKYDIEKINFSGLVAQEVDAAAKKINYDFSGVDKTGKILSLRYADFVPSLVKAVQELSSQNDSLKNENASLRKDFNDLKNLVLSIQQKQEACSPCNAPGANAQTYNAIITDGASLQQNVPNPFSHSTTIGYTLPQKFSRAQMMITDKAGHTLLVKDLSGAGKGNVTVDASVLAAGAYNYSLFVDGKLIATRQMEHLK
jgi:hypothetical protein